MSKQSFFTHITPLPASMTRDEAVAQLHNHALMIELNPLIVKYVPAAPPPNVPADEVESMRWYDITDVIQYIPGTSVKGEVTYKGGLYDFHKGLQTHIFAPGGVEIRGKWVIGGNMPGEPREPMEIGVDKPREGLYLREDVHLTCNMFLTNFVKKNLKKSHAGLVEKLVRGEGSLRPPGSSHSSFNATVAPRSKSVDIDRASMSSFTSSNHSRQTSHTASKAIPLPLENRIDFSKCGCKGGMHAPGCALMETYRSQQLKMAKSDQARPPSATQIRPSSDNRTPSWDKSPPNILPSSELFICTCKGGTHETGCPGRRGLGLRMDSPPQQRQRPAQPIHGRSESSLQGPFKPSVADTKLPIISMPQQDQGWNDHGLHPAPLMVRSRSQGNVMEIEADAVQRYYEYQASRVAELE